MYAILPLIIGQIPAHEGNTKSTTEIFPAKRDSSTVLPASEVRGNGGARPSSGRAGGRFVPEAGEDQHDGDDDSAGEDGSEVPDDRRGVSGAHVFRVLADRAERKSITTENMEIIAKFNGRGRASCGSGTDAGERAC